MWQIQRNFCYKVENCHKDRFKGSQVSQLWWITITTIIPKKSIQISRTDHDYEVQISYCFFVMRCTYKFLKATQHFTWKICDWDSYIQQYSYVAPANSSMNLRQQISNLHFLLFKIITLISPTKMNNRNNIKNHWEKVHKENLLIYLKKC